jgi:hypothetical protein
MMLGRTMAVAVKKLSGPSFAAAGRPSHVVSTIAAFPHNVVSPSLLSGSGTTTPTILQLPPQSQNYCRRWHWQIHLTKTFDKESGKFKYDEWTESRSLNVTRFAIHQPTLVNGTALLSRDLGRTEHVKPTRLKKLRNARVEYTRKMKRVGDLLNYIQFISSKNRHK